MVFNGSIIVCGIPGSFIENKNKEKNTFVKCPCVTRKLSKNSYFSNNQSNIGNYQKKKHNRKSNSMVEDALLSNLKQVLSESLKQYIEDRSEK